MSYTQDDINEWLDDLDLKNETLRQEDDELIIENTVQNEED